MKSTISTPSLFKPAVSVLWIILSVVSIFLILRGRTFDILLFAIILVPIFLTLYSKTKAYWFAIIAGTAQLFVSIPIPLAGGLAAPIFLIPVMTLGILLIEHLVSRKVWNRSANLTDKLFLFAAAWATAILLKDPPGSGLMGHESAGLSSSLLAVMGIWSYFLGEPIVNRMGSYKKNLFLFLLIGFIAFIQFFSSTGFTYYGALFHRQMWIVCAVILSFLLYRSNNKNQSFPIAFLVATLLFIFFGSLAIHRSRPLFAIGMTIIALFAYRKMNRVLPVFIILGAVAFIVIVVLNPQLLPDNAKRALSIFITLDVDTTGMSGELGWASNFRKEVYSLAIDRIREKPFFGSGFGFNTMEVIQNLNMQALSGKSAVVSTVGSYHNSFLALGVRCGIILPIIYLIAMFRVIKDYTLWCRSIKSGELKLIAVSILIYMVPIVGQSLMNGSLKDIMIISFIIGIAHALMLKNNQEALIENN